MKKELADKRREHFLKGKAKGVFDEMLVCREIYNDNDFDIIFTRQTQFDRYILDAGIKLGAMIMVCKAKDWLFIPHAYFTTKASNGADIYNVVVNFGDNMFKGNKLPSLPVVDTKYQGRG